jgi:hypothetical protein
MNLCKSAFVGLAAVLPCVAGLAAPPSNQVPAWPVNQAMVLVTLADQAVQERFKTDSGVPDHSGVFKASGFTVGQKLALDKANALGIPCAAGLVTLPHTSGLKTGIKVTGPVVVKPLNAPFKMSTTPQLDQALTSAPAKIKGVIGAVQHGALTNLQNGPALYALRPIRATSSACLSCHAGAKPGETLGAVLYVLAAAQRPFPGARTGAK